MLYEPPFVPCLSCNKLLLLVSHFKDLLYKANSQEFKDVAFFLLQLYQCVICKYKHPCQDRCRKHALIKHFCSVRVFSCIYCPLGCADQQLFNCHLDADHAKQKVDFLFNHDKLVELNSYLNASVTKVWHHINDLLPCWSQLQEGSDVPVPNLKTAIEENIKFLAEDYNSRKYTSPKLNETIGLKKRLPSSFRVSRVDKYYSQIHAADGKISDKAADLAKNSAEPSETSSLSTESKGRIVTVRNLLEASRGQFINKVSRKAAKVKDMLLSSAKGPQQPSSHPEDGLRCRQGVKPPLNSTHPSPEVGNPKDQSTPPQTAVDPGVDASDGRRYNLRQRKKSMQAYVEKSETTDDSEDDMTLAKIRKTHVKSSTPLVAPVAPAIVSVPTSGPASGAISSMPVHVLTLPTNQQAYLLPGGQVMSPAPGTVLPSSVMLAQPLQVVQNQGQGNIIVLPQTTSGTQSAVLQQGAMLMQPLSQTQGAGFQMVTDSQGNKMLVQSAVVPHQVVQQVGGLGSQVVQAVGRLSGSPGQVLQMVPDSQGSRLFVPALTPGVQLAPTVRPAGSTYVLNPGVGVLETSQHKANTSSIQSATTRGKDGGCVTSTQTKPDQKPEMSKKYIVIEPDSEYDEQSSGMMVIAEGSDPDQSGVTVSVGMDDQSPPTLECYMCRVCGCLQQDMKNIEKHLQEHHMIFNTCKTCSKSFRKEATLMEHCLEEGHIRVDRVSKFMQQREMNKNLLVILIPLMRDKDGDLDIPVFYCLLCGMVHVHQPFIRSHIIKEHGPELLGEVDQPTSKAPYNQYDVTLMGGKAAVKYNSFLKSNMRRASLRSVSDLKLLCNNIGPPRSDAVIHRLKKSRCGFIEAGTVAVQPPLKKVSKLVGQDQVSSTLRLDNTASGSRVDRMVQQVQDKVKIKHFLNETAATQSGGTRLQLQLLNKCQRCGFSSEYQKEVRQHILQTHCHQFDYVYKCVYCDYGCFEFPTFTNHVRIEHANKPMDMVINSKILGRLNNYVSACIKREYTALSQDNPANTTEFATEETFMPDTEESCVVSTTTEVKAEESSVSIKVEMPGNSTAGLLDMSVPAVERGGKEEGLLTYDPTAFVPVSGLDNSVFFKDEEDMAVEESENMTGDAYACKLCAYSCETEERIKKHLQSAHIADEIYPFTCPYCVYRAPSALRIAQHIIYKHKAGKKPSPMRLAKIMMSNPDEAKKIMKDQILYQRFLQELDCLYRNCVEKSMI